MWALWRLKARVRASIKVNQFFYRLRKAPLIKKWISSEVFSAYWLKSRWRIFYAIWSFLKSFYLDALWYLIIYFICTLHLKFTGGMHETVNFSILGTVFFFLMILGNLCVSALDTSGGEFEYIVEKFYVRNAKTYAHVLLIEHIVHFLFYHGLVLYLASFVERSFSLRLLLALPVIVSMRLFVAWWELSRLYRYGKRTLPWSFTISSIVGAVAITAAYVAGYITVDMTPFFSYVTFIFGIAFASGMLCILWRSTHYDLFLSHERQALEDMLTGNITLGLNERTKKDFIVNVPDGIERKRGYEALHAIFFYRNAKRFRKSFFKRLCVAGIGITLLNVGFFIANRVFLVEASLTGLFEQYGVWIFLMLWILFTENFTRELFLQMDRFLFVYPFYRRRAAVMKSFWIRFRVLFSYNLAIATFLAIGGWLTGKIFQETIPHAWYAIVLGSAAFFSIHTIGMYFLFQPYTSEMKMHSTPYSIANTIVSITCTIFYTKALRTNEYLLAIIGAMAFLWSVGLFVATYFFAPKTFKPRD